ncbi:aminotransferase class I/II-fold pyridoxal phosphate-dependent enzyme [Actinoplanes derwentensis]|uniref:8-amino-7-oxononanoate synthase n=1 Tax=Actinoplanes derwentensis TaxID=113562 RepID=A0A1H1R9J7_9ACTN|nr:aminotransferase class I/II-fold pyridoxal phosphate-dependent enzyme [Actinoplanes derwentensis]GID88050.1 2-amino-3-ketobutyrate CoA ligase [Actinoplanes derwentensis]SDS32373.1 glycine C-acetyltransferase [Actinoplanes derwentensis]
MIVSEGWQRLEPKLNAIRTRLSALEYEPDRRHSFLPFTPEPDSPYVGFEGSRYLMMSGYSYLGLAGDPRVKEAAKVAVDQYGTGAHGVRALAGSLPLHEELEAAVARFLGREAAMVFGSGYAANVGTVGALVGPGDTVLIDKLDHASIVDGCQLSGATVTRFRHNDPEHLDRRLTDAKGTGLKLVIVDSVYSMDGDVAPLPELRKVCDAHGALLMVDEAHALGVIGATGRGIEEHFGDNTLVDVKLGTLSKAIPATGGWVAGPQALIDHLRFNARPFLFSAALAPAQAGAALESLRVLDLEPHRVTHIQRESARLRQTLNAAGIDTGTSETAVIPIIAGSDEKAYDLATACRKAGVIGLPVVSPAVPNTQARLRIAVTARHSAEDLDVAAAGFLEAAHAIGLIPSLP